MALGGMGFPGEHLDGVLPISFLLWSQPYLAGSDFLVFLCIPPEPVSLQEVVTSLLPVLPPLWMGPGRAGVAGSALGNDSLTEGAVV